MSNKKKFQMPHTMAILFGCVVLIAVLTYIIPAGEYARVVSPTGRKVVDANSFKYIASTPITLMGILTSIARGFSGASSILAMTFFSGGAIMILRRIGVIDAAMSTLARKFEGRGLLAIPVLMTIFAIIDNFIGTPELCMVYIPIVMPLMFRLGFDSITTMGTVVLGSAVGFTAATANPFTVAIGQKLSELPLYSGWQLRLCTLVVMLAIGVLYVMRYARKVQKNPELSCMYEEDAARRAEFLAAKDETVMSPRLRAAGVWAVVAFVGMFVGIISQGWDMPEMTGMFLVMGVGAGLIAGMSVRDICVAIGDGCKDMMFGCIYISLARATYVVMNDGHIIDTIVHSMAVALNSMPAQFAIIGVFLFVTGLNFFVSSGSGKAVMLFPILSPLADLCGITRQTAILAYQFGDGFTNMFWPTNGTQGACLGITGIPWNKWARFYFPLLCIWYVVGSAILLFAQSIKYGPF